MGRGADFRRENVDNLDQGLAVSRDCRTQLKDPGSCVADRLHEVDDG